MRTTPIIHCPYCSAYYTPQQLGIQFNKGVKCVVICGSNDVFGNWIGCKKQFEVSFQEENILENQDIVEERQKPGILNKILKKKHNVVTGSKTVISGVRISATIKRRS